MPELKCPFKKIDQTLGPSRTGGKKAGSMAKKAGNLICFALSASTLRRIPCKASKLIHFGIMRDQARSPPRMWRMADEWKRVSDSVRASSGPRSSRVPRPIGDGND